MLVQVANALELVILTAELNEELPNAIKRYILGVDQNTDRITEDLICNSNNLRRHGCREECNLGRLGKSLLENAHDLLVEQILKHLICLIQNENTDVVAIQNITIYKIVNTTRRTNNKLNTLLECTDVVTDLRATHGAQNLELHVAADRRGHLGNLLCQFMRVYHDKNLRSLNCRIDP